MLDRGITMERGWDFYLQAHHCIQGTAKPAHYVVVHNEFDNLTADNVEEFVSPSLGHGMLLFPLNHYLENITDHSRRRTTSAIHSVGLRKQCLSVHLSITPILHVNGGKST